MKVYDAKQVGYEDRIIKKRRRTFVLRLLFFIGLVIVIIGILLYLFFFSGLLEIKKVSVNGLDKIDGDEFNSQLNKRFDSKLLGLFEYQKNVVFFDGDDFRAEILSVFPEIKEITVHKEPPHTLSIDVEEKETAGIWCFKNDLDPLISDCKYFDKKGNIWGEAAMSSGFLVLNVDDRRRLEVQKTDFELLADIVQISERLKEMNIFVRKFIIPDDYFGDFEALTADNYKLLFSTDSDIEEQLDVLEIFLIDKKRDNLKFQYIDLRINGRVYYK